MTALLRRLEREHDAMRDMLVLLEREVERFRRGGRPDFAMMRDIVDYCRAFRISSITRSKTCCTRASRLATQAPRRRSG